MPCTSTPGTATIADRTRSDQNGRASTKAPTTIIPAGPSAEGHHRGKPRHNRRIRCIEDGAISFSYLDNREKGEPVEKIMRLSAEEFIRRFLAHIPPSQFRRVRYYGFLANSERKNKLTLCRALLGLEDPECPVAICGFC